MSFKSIVAGLALAFPMARVAQSASVDCGNTTLVWTMSGPDTSCNFDTSGGDGHYWPVGISASECHGWRATDKNGKVHDNSAKNIKCAADGKSLTYDQYAGNLDCSGDLVSKSFVLNECHQGRPPVLYDKAINLACCNSNSAECKEKYTGIPRVQGGQVTDQKTYKNGDFCIGSDADGSSGNSGSVTAISSLLGLCTVAVSLNLI